MHTRPAHLASAALLALVLVLVSPAAAAAVDDLAHRANFGASLSWTNTQPVDGDAESNGVTGATHLGYFVNGWLETGAAFELMGLEHNHHGVRFEDTFLNGLGYVKGHYVTDWNLVPYAGLQIGFSRAEFDDGVDTWETSSLAMGVMGGVRAFFSKNACMHAEYNFLRTNHEVNPHGVSSDFDHHRLFVGFSYFFSGSGL